MTWYEKLLDSARDVAPTVAGGAAMAPSGGNPALCALASSVIGRVVGKTALKELVRAVNVFNIKR